MKTVLQFHLKRMVGLHVFTVYREEAIGKLSLGSSF